MRIFLKVVWPWTVLWTVQGCVAPTSATIDEARPADLEVDVRKVMTAYSSTEESEGVFRTGWEEEPLEAAVTELPQGARWLRVRYEVSLQGTTIQVRARAEVFVHHGPHRKTWDWLSARPFEESLLSRIVEMARGGPTQ